MNVPTQSATQGDPVVARILYFGSLILWVAGWVLAVLIARDYPLVSPLVLLHVFLGFVGAATFLVLRSGRQKLAAYTLIGGYWAGATVVAALNGGLRGPNLINYPLILVIAGWQLGVRPTIAFAVLTELAFCAFLAADRLALMPTPDYQNLSAYFVFLTAITLATATATILARSGYLRRQADLERAVNELAIKEDLLRHHRDQLESDIEARTQELAAATRAAEVANLAKSQFLANMSHEIRTPLNAIVGMANLMRRHELKPDQAQRLEKLELASEHLLRVINNILDLSKIEAGKLVLQESAIDIGQLCAAAEQMLHDQAKAKGLAITVEVPALPFRLSGDATRLAQAIINYLGNAIKFTQAGQIALRVVLLDETGNDALLRFEVQDTGMGIAPDKLDKLFTPFEQVDSSNTRQHGGTGLGLVINKRLAALMQGDAGATSQLGHGSVFWFTARMGKLAPLAVPEQPAPPAEPAPLANQGVTGHRILLVEDDLFNQEVALCMLEDLGFKVDVAGDGQVALDQCNLNRYDLILMDMQMPRMDGLEATRRIRQLPAYATTPILAMTANAFAENRTQCLDAGMNDFLTKPVRAELLRETLLRWLDAGLGHAAQ